MCSYKQLFASLNCFALLCSLYLYTIISLCSCQVVILTFLKSFLLLFNCFLYDVLKVLYNSALFSCVVLFVCSFILSCFYVVVNYKFIFFSIYFLGLFFCFYSFQIIIYNLFLLFFSMGFI